jgi:hypothetical protein
VVGLGDNLSRICPVKPPGQGHPRRLWPGLKLRSQESNKPARPLRAPIPNRLRNVSAEIGLRRNCGDQARSGRRGW